MPSPPVGLTDWGRAFPPSPGMLVLPPLCWKAGSSLGINTQRWCSRLSKLRPSGMASGCSAFAGASEPHYQPGYWASFICSSQSQFLCHGNSPKTSSKRVFSDVCTLFRCLPVSTLAFHLHCRFNEMPNGCLGNKVLPSGTRHCLSVALCMERKGRDNQGGDIATEHIRGAGRGGGDSFRVSWPEFSFQLCLSAGSVTLGESLHLCKSCLGLFTCKMRPQYLPARVWGLTEGLHGASRALLVTGHLLITWW